MGHGHLVRFPANSARRWREFEACPPLRLVHATPPKQTLATHQRQTAGFPLHFFGKKTYVPLLDSLHNSWKENNLSLDRTLELFAAVSQVLLVDSQTYTSSSLSLLRRESVPGPQTSVRMRSIRRRPQNILRQPAAWWRGPAVRRSRGLQGDLTPPDNPGRQGGGQQEDIGHLREVRPGL